MSLRVVTFNTRGSLGADGRRDTRRVAEAVRVLSPDVVCFQEIHHRLPWSGREDQPGALSVLLARMFVFQRLARFGGGGYGNGVALRALPEFRQEHLLPSRKEPRGALEVRLRGAGGTGRVTVFCTHWGLDAEERLEQADALAKLVSAARAPVLVCGDFNEAPDAPAVRYLRDDTGLLDADEARNRLTFPSDKPEARIDLILHSPELNPQGVEVLTTLASDHLPVVADFT